MKEGWVEYMNDDKVEEALAEVGKEVLIDVVKPTAESIGNNLGIFVDGVMGWLGLWGEKQRLKREKKLQEYKLSIIENISKIDPQNLKEPDVNLVGPCIEASKYYIDELYCREMFSKIIASSCDATMENTVHPSFVNIIKQLSPIDARFLASLKDAITYPAVKILEHNPDGKITPYMQLIIDLKENQDMFTVEEFTKLSGTVELLERLGIIILNERIIEKDYKYDKFKEHWYYKGIESLFEKESSVELLKYRIEFTNYGYDFVRSCIPT